MKLLNVRLFVAGILAFGTLLACSRSRETAEMVDASDTGDVSVDLTDVEIADDAQDDLDEETRPVDTRKGIQGTPCEGLYPEPWAQEMEIGPGCVLFLPPCYDEALPNGGGCYYAWDRKCVFTGPSVKEGPCTLGGGEITRPFPDEFGICVGEDRLQIPPTCNRCSCTNCLFEACAALTCVGPDYPGNCYEE